MAKKTTVKMTPEILAKLRGVSVVTDTIDYVHEIEDVPVEFHPVFKLKSFTVEDSRKFKEISKKEDTDLDEVFENVLREHLVGWKNLYDLSTGEAFEYVADKDGGADEDTYFALPLGLRANILGFLHSLSGM